MAQELDGSADGLASAFRGGEPFDGHGQQPDVLRFLATPVRRTCRGELSGRAAPYGGRVEVSSLAERHPRVEVNFLAFAGGRGDYDSPAQHGQLSPELTFGEIAEIKDTLLISEMSSFTRETVSSKESRALKDIAGSLGNIMKNIEHSPVELLTADKSEIDKLEEAAKDLPRNGAADGLRGIIRDWAADAAKSDGALRLGRQEVARALNLTKSLISQERPRKTLELLEFQRRVALVSDFVDPAKPIHEGVTTEALQEAALNFVPVVGDVVRIARLIELIESGVDLFRN